MLKKNVLLPVMTIFSMISLPCVNNAEVGQNVFLMNCEKEIAPHFGRSKFEFQKPLPVQILWALVKIL